MVQSLRGEDIEVSLACETLGVSRSGYYAWRSRPESERARENKELLERIRDLHRKSRGIYGSPRIHAALKEEGIACGENRVARLMSKNNVRSIVAKPFKVQTTDSNHELPIAGRVFEAEHAQTTLTAPNQVWCGDITYVPTEEGWLFLAVFLDVFSRKVVGHATADHMQTELVLEALDMALGGSALVRDQLIAHSDRGSQYAAEAFRERLKDEGIIASMSRKGNCYDNAFVESFFHTLKTELIYQTKFATREEAKRAIFEYIEVFYNRERIHSSIGYMTPTEFETLAS